MIDFKVAKPFIIAGPCSAETEEQVMAVASALSNRIVHLFRAGVWKPRTRPGSFEGNGEIALKWLKEVKKRYKLPVTIEVAEPKHLELALEYDIDAIWIGARTTVNPFQVQHISDALRGINIPVLIKNPVNPDIELWLGAIERIEKSGCTNIAAIHRGFSGYKSTSGYRNQPNWLIPIELKRRRPDITLFCDPSHISGNNLKVGEVAQKAMDMHFDGLMIETHHDPVNAWSDAAQQVTPAQLDVILAQLIVRDEFTKNMNSLIQLEYLRQMMDNIDSEIIDLIAKRMELSEQIGLVKRENNMTIYQPERWRELVASLSQRAANHSMSKEFIIELYEKIHHESIRTQLEVLERGKNWVKK